MEQQKYIHVVVTPADKKKHYFNKRQVQKLYTKFRKKNEQKLCYII